MIVETKRARLLVVEDEIITARDLQDSLEELGYDVPDVASSGEEALELAAVYRPDLVLMDINLGASSRDGVDVAAELLEQFGIPVIYLTAYADTATLARASVTAPLGYLTKPFERRELHATIQMALVKRQMDEQLRQSESWYSTSLASIGDGVIATDASGNVKFVNPVAESLTGWTHAEALGKPLDEIFALFDSANKQPRTGLAAKVLASDKTLFIEEDAMLRSRLGAAFPVDDSAAPIRNQRDGRVIGVVVVFRDLSEKKQIAAELERARRLESLGTLAGGMAHDLNNILAIIAGNVSLANAPGASAQMQARAFTKIDAAVRRAKSLTSQFLTFSKGGAPMRRKVDLRAVASEEMQLMFEDGDLAKPEVRHRLEGTPDLWNAEVDEDQIRRVIENFLRNAQQSLPAIGGNVVLRVMNCKRTELPAEFGANSRENNDHASHYVRLEVSDSGCGITPEDLPRVCDPYFTTRTTGSGLGLSVCHSIARKHNGFLRILSQVGKGTVAEIYLPAEAPPTPSSNKELSRPPLTRKVDLGAAIRPGAGKPVEKLRVLVMDDEPLMRELLAQMLAHLGHRSVTAATGEEALRLYQQASSDNPFDVVCIDLVNKAGMDGQEMIKRLWQFDPNVLALVCSGYSDHPIMANYRDYGFSGCLPKPVSLEDLKRALSRAMAHRKPRPE